MVVWKKFSYDTNSDQFFQLSKMRLKYRLSRSQNFSGAFLCWSRGQPPHCSKVKVLERSWGVQFNMFPMPSMGLRGKALSCLHFKAQFQLKIASKLVKYKSECQPLSEHLTSFLMSFSKLHGHLQIVVISLWNSGTTKNYKNNRLGRTYQSQFRVFFYVVELALFLIRIGEVLKRF